MDYLSAFVRDHVKGEEPQTSQILEEPEFIRGQNRTLRTCAPPPIEKILGESLEFSRKKITTAMRAYMELENPRHMLLIPAPPGTGKTWAGVDFAYWAKELTGKRMFYAGPRHDFFMDITRAASQQGKNTSDWYEWLPRQKGKDEYGLDQTCIYPEEINLWLHKGYQGMDYCSQICGWDYINRGCIYHKQKQRQEPLIYGQHAHVVLGHPLTEQFACVVGDENPMNAFINEWRIPAKHIHWGELPVDESLTEILYDMQKLCASDVKLHGSAMYKALGARRVMQACETSFLPASDAILAPRLRSADDSEKSPYNFLVELVPLMLRESMATVAEVDFLHRVWLDKNGLTLLLRRHINEQMPQHIIWFDATGRKGLYEALFERDVEVLDVHPQLTGKIHQIVDRANGKSSLVDKKGDDTHRVTQTKAQVDKICTEYKNPAVVTYQAIEKKLDREQTLHFYGSRGSNLMQECDALIVVGTPQPPLYQIEKAAKAIWFKRSRPFDTTWYTQDRMYNYIDDQGSGYCYPVSVYADPELNELLWQYREAEIIQSAHRARILFRDVPVYLMTNIPIDELPPARLLTIRELMDAPEGVDVFLWHKMVRHAEEKSQGFITLTDFMENLKISKPTALKYMDALIATGDWEPAIIKSTGGRPPKAIKRGGL